MTNRKTSAQHDSYAGLSVVIGLISIALGGGYWYWDYAKKRDRDHARAERLRNQTPLTIAPSAQQPPSATSSPQPITTTSTMPPAQAMPVPPPSLAQVKQVQHSLNIVNRKLPGDDGYVEEIGTAGPKTFKALQAFQRAHGMVPTGKMDGMTLSLLAKSDSEERKLEERGGPFHFVLHWKDPTVFTRMVGDTGHWVVEDSLHFVNDVGTDRSHPPSEDDIVKLLIKHYGANSSVGKDLAAKNYANWGIAAQVAA